MGKDRLALEVDMLLDKLLLFQENVGGKEEEKKEMDAAFKDDLFLGVKDKLTKTMTTVREKLKEKKDADEQSNKLEMTKINKAIRDFMAQMDKDVQELKTLNDVEKKKRKSKFARPELDRRDQIVDACREEIRALRSAFQSGGQPMTSTTNNLLRMEDHDLFQQGGAAFPGKGLKGPNDPNRPYEQEEVNDEQQQRLQQLRDDQRDQDKIIDQIGDGVIGLSERARAMNEQVATQKAIIDQLENQVDATHEQLLGVNDKLKATLKELEGDGSFCMDILCVIMLLGMIAVLIQLVQESDDDGDDDANNDGTTRF